MQAGPSFRPANPRILPTNRNVLIIPAVADVRAVVVADFHGLMFRDRNRRSYASTRIPLHGVQIRDAAQAGLPAVPEIPVQRDPQPRFDVVAEMPFKCAYWSLGLCLRPGEELIVRKEFLIRREKPGR